MANRYSVLLAAFMIGSTAAPGLAAPAPQKVRLCHYPLGQPTNAQTLTVGDAALPAHLAHGDLAGPCPNDCRQVAVACDDDDACTDDVCGADGACTHVPVECNDGDVCTADSCGPVTGCIYAPVTGASCDDGKACTWPDRCADGTCTGVAIAGCCTSDADCAQSNACITEGCVAGQCAQVAAVDCDDRNACTADACNPVDGACVNVPTVCDDHNACTSDGCNPQTGACSSEAISATCDDADECTSGDVCAEGECTGAKIPGCCRAATAASDCDDADRCTTDTCADGFCSHAPVTCADGDACTTDVCDPASGTCTNAARTCDDADACTTDACQSGSCVNTLIDCDDGLESTFDWCENGACAHRENLCCENTNTPVPADGVCPLLCPCWGPITIPEMLTVDPDDPFAIVDRVYFLGGDGDALYELNYFQSLIAFEMDGALVSVVGYNSAANGMADYCASVPTNPACTSCYSDSEVLHGEECSSADYVGFCVASHYGGWRAGESTWLGLKDRDAELCRSERLGLSGLSGGGGDGFTNIAPCGQRDQ